MATPNYPLDTLCEELNHLHSAAAQIDARLASILTSGAHLPDETVPSLNAARRASKQLATHLGASVTLAQAAAK